MYKVGDRVSLKKDPEKKGAVDMILGQIGGIQYYSIQFDDGHLTELPEIELINEISIKTAWDLLSNNLLKDYRDYAISSTMAKIRNSSANTISTLKASRTIFKPYQYIPLIKFLNSDLKRILIADEVGLGKTIEAGHILLEQMARGQLRNVLVLCTNSLKIKWKTELKEKFNFSFRIYDQTKDFISEVEEEIHHSTKSINAILNYEKCRNQRVKNLLNNTGYGFDMVICDEAHTFRNSETQTHKGVKAIIDNSSAVVFLTATPIMTDLSNLQNLLKVLDEETYGTKDIFFNAIEENKPFVRALSRLNRNENHITIAKDLGTSLVERKMTINNEIYFQEKSTINELYNDDKLYQRTINRLLKNDKGFTNVANIQNDLIHLNALNHIYTRNKKRDVLKDRVKRNAQTLVVNFSNQEKELYNNVISEFDGNSLALMTRKRQISSCIPAFQLTKEEITSSCGEFSIHDTKFELFNSIVKEVVSRQGKKLIVFAFFSKTLLYLKSRLESQGYKVALIYGPVKDRTEVIEKFKKDNTINILLSSEVGSEGLDLQFCDALVNYDLPWNPMKVEQRIGRIDRVGQQSEVINIYNLIIKNTIEEKIHNRLFRRIKLFEESLGDLEEILGEKENLGEMIDETIKSLYTTKLSEKEIEERIDSIRQVFENEKIHIEELKSQLAESFANDLYFKNEIDNITNAKRYITENELKKYLESIIRKHLTTIQISHKSDMESVLKIPTKQNYMLFQFIEDYLDSKTSNPELHVMFKKFKRFKNQKEISITFNQDYAFQNKSIEFISAFHPLINAITNYYHSAGLDKHQAHKISIKAKYIDHIIPEGYYLQIIYNVSVIKSRSKNKSSKIDTILPIIIDLNGNELKNISDEKQRIISSCLHQNGEQVEHSITLNNNMVNEIRRFATPWIINQKNAIANDEKLRFESKLSRRSKQEIKYIDNRISRIEKQLREEKGIRNILLSELEDFKNKKDEIMRDIKESKIDVNHTLMSVNLIQVNV